MLASPVLNRNMARGSLWFRALYPGLTLNREHSTRRVVMEPSEHNPAPQGLAVVVARFQVPELHAGHKHLLNYARNHRPNTRLLCVLGDHGGFPTKHDPLPYRVRELMVKSEYPDATVVRLLDTGNDKTWCEALNALIAEVLEQETLADAVLYGSRKSFLEVYRGPFAMHLVPELPNVSGTQAREALDIEALLADPALAPTVRAGLIYAQQCRSDVVYGTVDVAILNEDRTKVLLGYKEKDGGKWRFVGGFVDRRDKSLQVTARRETGEEVNNICITNPKYIDSCKVDDPRYRDADGIMTKFFEATYVSGEIAPTDDLDEVAWWPIEQIKDVLVHFHLELADLLITHLSAA